MYFPKNNNTDWKIERHRINIPTLKWIRIKEFGYIPVNSKVISGTVSMKSDKYYVSVVCEIEKTNNLKPKSEPIGIDLGIKDFAVMSNETIKKNINKTTTVS